MNIPRDDPRVTAIATALREGALDGTIRTYEDEAIVAITALRGYFASQHPVPESPTGDWVVTLGHHGDKKIQVIKEIRSFTNCGLKEAKDLSEGPSGTIVGRNLSFNEATRYLNALIRVGALASMYSPTNS